MMKFFVIPVFFVLIGCATQANYVVVQDPYYFTIERNLSVVDAKILGGEYKQSGEIYGKPAFHNTTMGATVVGALSNTQLASHVFLNEEGKVCFSSISFDFCAEYKPKLYKKQ